MSRKADIRGDLNLDSSGVDRALQTANKSVKGFVGGSIKQFGALAGAAGFGGLATSAINLGSKISDMAVQLNIGAEELQVLEFAAREAGVETGIMERAIRNVQLRTQQAIEGNKRYAEAYQMLGLDMQKVNKLPVEQKMEAIAKAQAAATDQQAAYNAVAAILGERAGPKMQEILQNLAQDGFPQMEKAAKNSGTIMDEDVIAKMDKAADKIEQFKRRITVMTASVLTYVVPGFGILKDGLGFVGEAFGTAILNAQAFFKLITKNIMTAIAPAIKQFRALGVAVDAALTINPLEKARLFKEAASMSREAMKDLLSVPGKLAENFREFTGDVKFNMSELGNSVESRANSIQESWSEMFGEVEEAGRGAANTMIDANADVAQSAVDSAEVQKAAQESVKKSVEETTAAIKAQKTAFDGGKVQFGTKGLKPQELETEKLKFLLKSTQDEINSIKTQMRGTAGGRDAADFLTFGLQRDVQDIEKELAIRSRYFNLSGATKDLLFNPFEQERLNRFAPNQTEADRQNQAVRDSAASLSRIEDQIARLGISLK